EPRSQLGQTTVHALREEATRVGSTLYEVGVAVTDVPWPRAIEQDVEPTPDGVGCFGIGRTPGTEQQELGVEVTQSPAVELGATQFASEVANLHGRQRRGGARADAGHDGVDRRGRHLA